MKPAVAVSVILLTPLLIARDQPSLFASLPPTTKAVVLLFTRTDCPISNRYAPEVHHLYDKYKDHDVRFYLVYPDKDETPQSIAQHKLDYSYSFDAIRDPKHELVTRAHATITPEAAVFVREGAANWQLAYHGRIDDRNSDFGKSRPEPKERDLDEALSAVLNGKPAPHPVTKAIGCYIADLN